MKKFFTLCAVALAAASMYAQAPEECYVVTSDDMVEVAWETQMWVVLDEENPLAEGDVVSLTMTVKADHDATSGSQFHAAPGNYLHWSAVGQAAFTTEWNEITLTGTVAAEAAGAWTIAFNLNDDTTANTYYVGTEIVCTVNDEEVEVGFVKKEMTGTGGEIVEGEAVSAETSLNVVKSASNAVLYNILGQRVTEAKGLVIKNGVKTVIK